MKTTFRLPPSPRDFAVYDAIVLKGNSTRDAAYLFKLSQTRVRQIASRVLEWLAETLPEVSAADAEKQLRLARQIAGDRLQLLYGMAFRRFETQLQPQFGMLAMRITEAQLRLGHFGGAIDGVMADAEDMAAAIASRDQTGSPSAASRASTRSNVGCMSDSEMHLSSSPLQAKVHSAALHAPYEGSPQATKDIPPDRDCSADSECEKRDAELAAFDAAANAAEESTSDRLKSAQRAARQEFLASAGPLLSEPGTPSPATLSIEADLRQHGEQTLQRLSRRQRRRFANAK
jgi:hypothetical protein